jgi:hypothetical protein
MADQELIVKIGARIDGLVNNLKASEDKIRAFGKVAQDIGKSLTKNVTAPIAAIGTAAFAASVRLGNFADGLLDLEQQTGLSTDALQEYRQVAVKAGIATDAVANASENLQRRLASGEEGSKDLTDGLNALGISARDAQGNLRSIDKIVEESISKLSDYSDITERNQLALKIFGRSAGELAPLLALGSKEIENAKNQARELGLVLSKEALEGANEFREEFDTLKATVSGITNEIGAAFLPVAKQLVSIFQNQIVPAIRDAIQFLSNLSTTTKTTITVILGITAAIGPLLFSIGALTKAIPFLIAGLNALKLSVILITSPIGLAVAALTSLAFAFNFAEKSSKQYAEINEKVSQSNEQVKLATQKLAETQKFLNGLLSNYNSLSEEEKQNAQEQLTIRLNAAKSLLELAKASRAAAIEEAIRITVFDRIKQSLGLTSGVFERLQSIISETSGEINGLESDINSLEESFKLLGKTVAESGNKIATSGQKAKRTFETAIGGGGGRGDFGGTPDLTAKLAQTGISRGNQGPSFDQVIDNIIDTIDTKFPDVIAKIQSFAFDIDNLIRNNIEGSFIDLGNAIGQALAEGQNVFEAIGKSLLNSVGIFLADFGSLLIKYGVAGIAFGKLTKAIAAGGAASIGAGILAVAAGTALVAIGGAIRGLAGRQGGGGGIATSGVGSGVGDSFGGATGGAFDFNRQVELVGEFSVSGSQLKYVIQNSENFEN